MCAYRGNAYIGDLLERRRVNDEARQRERLDLVLALHALVDGSVRHCVGFDRLRQSLSWTGVQLSDVLAHCEQDGSVRIEGEPGVWSHRGTRAALTADGIHLAEWVRAGCPDDDTGRSYSFTGEFTGANFAFGCTRDVRQATSGGRIDIAECRHLIQSAREELRPDVLSGATFRTARSLLDEMEDALGQAETPHDRLRSLAFALRDICFSAAGSGLYLAVAALVARLA